MADPFGIVGVIGVATQIIQLGVQFGLDWNDAPADTKSFIAELEVLKTIRNEEEYRRQPRVYGSIQGPPVYLAFTTGRGIAHPGHSPSHIGLPVRARNSA